MGQSVCYSWIHEKSPLSSERGICYSSIYTKQVLLALQYYIMLQNLRNYFHSNIFWNVFHPVANWLLYFVGPVDFCSVFAFYFLYLCICAACICTSGTVAEGGRATIKELSDQSGVNCLARWSKYFALDHKIHNKLKYTNTQIQKNTKIYKCKETKYISTRVHKHVNNTHTASRSTSWSRGLPWTTTIILGTIQLLQKHYNVPSYSILLQKAVIVIVKHDFEM